jgi:hypothetical protein
MQRTNIAVAHGDGIGPEIMQAVLDIIQATGAPLDFEKVDMGKDVYLGGHSTGMTESHHRAPWYPAKRPHGNAKRGGHEKHQCHCSQALEYLRE